jgi:hypothetical protein
MVSILRILVIPIGAVGLSIAIMEGIVWGMRTMQGQTCDISGMTYLSLGLITLALSGKIGQKIVEEKK